MDADDFLMGYIPEGRITYICSTLDEYNQIMPALPALPDVTLVYNDEATLSITVDIHQLPPQE